MKTLSVSIVLAAIFLLTGIPASAEPMPFGPSELSEPIVVEKTYSWDEEPDISKVAKWPIIYTGPQIGPLIPVLVEKYGKRVFLLCAVGPEQKIFIMGYAYLLNEQLKVMEVGEGGGWVDKTEVISPDTWRLIMNVLLMDVEGK